MEKRKQFNVLIPELYCSDFKRSLEFYTGVAEFLVSYSRPEQKFAFLEREGAQIMIEESQDPSRTWVVGELEYPYGRGINLQIKVSEVKGFYDKFQHANHKIVVPLEEKWYRADDALNGNLQFVVLDPDGYLLRFFQDLGMKNVR